MGDLFSFPQSNLTPNALEILTRRYLQKDMNGTPTETPKELFDRVASAVSQAEEKYCDDPITRPLVVDDWHDKFFDMMWNLDFLPNSPTLMNAGTGQGTLSACYVLPLDDSMESIMQAATDQAMVEKFGGGVGFPLSNLRPKGTPIKTTQGFACGPISVLRVLSQVGDMITQGGKRDGAHMAVMEVYHPDIEEFITCKMDEGKIHNFNISVGADSTFMQAVEDDNFIHLAWPLDKRRYVSVTDDTSTYFAEVDGIHDSVDDGKFIRARDLFAKIVDGAWRNGEPGMVWLDRINQDNTTPQLGQIQGTNPCGEQPLLGNESCNLGSINLGNFAKMAGNDVSEWSIFDERRFREVAQLATRFLDNIVDINEHPTEDTKEFNGRTRKIGLGVMGWADLLIRLSIPYNSKEALELADKIGAILKYEADAASESLGAERGNFPAFDESPLNSKNGGEWETMRNAWRLSIAPTGTISMLANCSSGIEPLFALAYKKHNMSAALEGVELFYINDDFLLMVHEYHEGTRDWLEKYIDSGQDIKDLIPTEWPNVFLTSSELDVDTHVRMQAAWQPYIDSGISKTINLPNEATVSQVTDAYQLAWSLGCKGITVYRSGSREKEVLVATTSAVESVEAPKSGSFVRPSRVHGYTDKVATGHGGMFVAVNSIEGREIELFASLGKSGACEGAFMEAIARLASTAFQHGASSDDVIEQLRGLTCCPVWHEGRLIKSPADGIAFTLLSDERDEKAEERVDSVPMSSYNSGSSCPECSSSHFEIDGGCEKCRDCGYSKCG